MWILISKKEGEKYYLHRGKTRHTIGRPNTDLVLKNDETISRQHAQIIPEENHIVLTDLGSKYGTFCNHNIENLIPISKNSPVILKNGERVRFGRYKNEWIVSKMNISTMMSTLKKSDKIKVHQYMTFLQGNIIENWEESCTHLTMNEITLTLKTLQALAAGIPIVTVEFWEKYIENLKEGKPLPISKDYLPKVVETNLPQKDFFNPIESRKVLFKGKYFVFLEEKNHQKFAKIISKAGGESSVLSEEFEISRLSKTDVIVVQNIIQQTHNRSSINIVLDYLKRIGRRLVPDIEIGLAIIYCSTKKYCNPEYNLMTEIIPATLESLSNTDVMARDTQDIIPNVSDMSRGTSLFNSADVEPSDDEDESTLSETQNIQKKNIFNVDDNDDDDIVGPSDGEESDILARCTVQSTLDLKGKRKRRLQSLEGNETKKPHLAPSFNNTSTQSSLYIPETIASSSIAIGKTCNSKLSSSSNEGKTLKRLHEPHDSEEYLNSPTLKRKRNINSQVNRNETDIFHEENDEINVPKIDQSKPELSVRSEIINIPEENVNANNIARIVETEPFIRPELSPSTKDFNADNKLESTGWLAKSISRIVIKNEQNESSASNVEINKSSWIDSIKNAFEVHVKDMSLTSRGGNRDEHLSLNESNITRNYVGKANFKAFVKKNNYKPQKVVVPTVPITINSG